MRQDLELKRHAGRVESRADRDVEADYRRERACRDSTKAFET